MPLLAFLALFSLPPPAPASLPASEVRGRVFYDQLNKKEPSFFFHSKESMQDGKRVVTAIYSDKDGKELVREENYFEEGKLVRSVYRQNQVNEHGEVSFREGKAHFTFTDHKGTESDSEDAVPDMILGSMIAPHVLQHWKELMAGESIKVRYMAIERCETVGFKFFKDGERTENGRVVVDLKMKPSSFIIAAVVKPIRLTFTKDEPRYLVEVEGRTPIRWPKSDPPKSRKDWKAIDARIVFDPPQAVQSSAAIPKQVEEAPEKAAPKPPR